MSDDLEDVMGGWQPRPVHQQLTVDIIDQTPDDDLVSVVFENVIVNLPEGDDEVAAVMSLHPSRRAVMLTMLLDGEVSNGGFNQFYFNTEAAWNSELPGALRLIGAVNLAALTERANEVYERNKAEITESQDGTLEGFADSYDDNPLNDLDDEFYDVKESEGLERLQVEFIRRHKNDFVG